MGRHPLQRQFVDSRQRVQHSHVFFGVSHLGFVENVSVAQSQIVVFVEESFLLHAGHVQHVEIADYGNEILDFRVGAGVGGVDTVEHVLWGLELVRADQHEVHIAETAQGFDQGVYGTTEGKIAAQTDGQIVHATEA